MIRVICIRDFPNTYSDARTTPTQSKSFRILQKITDTVDETNGYHPNQTIDSMTNTVESQLQQPQYSRQMSGQQINSTHDLSNATEQIRRMHLNQEQSKYF